MQIWGPVSMLIDRRRGAPGLATNQIDIVLDALHTLRANDCAPLAVRICEGFLLQQPNHRRTHLVLAACLADCGKRLDALTELNWCIANDPTDPIAHHNKARELQLLVSHAEAAESAKRATELNGAYLDAYWLLATSLLWLGQMEAAKRELLRLAEMSFNTGYGELARSLYELMISLPKEQFAKAWSEIAAKIDAAKV
jgi:tetratricopeptide (TPR) repeat protein